MKLFAKILDILGQRRAVLQPTTLFASAIVLLASVLSVALPDMSHLIPIAARPIDAVAVVTLSGLLCASNLGFMSVQTKRAAASGVIFLCTASLAALFGINLDRTADLARFNAWVLDPEIALAVAIGVRAILRSDREPAFMNLSRHALYVIIPAFGILSTLTGMAAELQASSWQPVVGINLPLAALMLIIALVEFAKLPQSRNPNMLGIALPLPAISYFIFAGMFRHVATGDTAGLLLDFVIITILITGARFLTGAVDVFFSMVDSADKRNAMLTRQNNVIQDLLYALAHDLRSPARGIVQTSEWLREDLKAKDYEQLQQRTDIISDRAEALYERLDAFVEYVRLGRFVAKRQTVALNLLAENLVDAMPHDAKKIITLHGHELTIQTDESALASILSNLLENAAIYADQDAPEIHLTWNTQGDDLMISVYNNGPSIRQGAIPKIFQPFRGAVSNTVQNGMALAITARLVEALGGKIAVHTDPASTKGTEFRCAIPLRNASAQHIA